MLIRGGFSKEEWRPRHLRDASEWYWVLIRAWIRWVFGWMQCLWSVGLNRSWFPCTRRSVHPTPRRFWLPFWSAAEINFRGHKHNLDMKIFIFQYSIILLQFYSLLWQYFWLLWRWGESLHERNFQDISSSWFFCWFFENNNHGHHFKWSNEVRGTRRRGGGGLDLRRRPFWVEGIWGQQKPEVWRWRRLMK